MRTVVVLDVLVCYRSRRNRSISCKETKRDGNASLMRRHNIVFLDGFTTWKGTQYGEIHSSLVLTICSQVGNRFLKQLPVSPVSLQFVDSDNYEPVIHQPTGRTAMIISLHKLRCSNPDSGPVRKL